MDNEVLNELSKEYENIARDIENSDVSALIPDIRITTQGISDEFMDTLNSLGFQDFLRIQKIKEYDKKKINTFLDKLNQMQIDLFGKDTPISLFELLKNNITTFQELESPAEFRRNDIQLEQIQRAKSTLQMVKSVISAMITTSPDGKFSPDNLYGYNVMLNKAAEKEGIIGKYGIISSESANLLREDINLIENKLNYLETLAKANSGSLIEEQGKIQDAILNSLYTAFTNDSATSAKNLKVGGKPLLSQDDILSVTSLPTKEQQVIQLEKLIYNNFESANGVDLESKLNELFQQFIEGGEDFRKTIIEGEDSNLTTTLSNLTKKDWYFYLHSIIALDSNTFYLNYKNLLEKEVSLGKDHNAKAPFYSQQFVLRQEMAYINGKRGKDIISHSIKFIQSTPYELVMEGKDSNYEPTKEDIYEATKNLSTFSIPYIYGVRGTGGTGKSTILGNFVLRMHLDRKAKGETVNIIACAPTEETTKILNNNIGTAVDNTIQNQTIQQLLKSVLGDTLYAELLEEVDAIKNSTKTDEPFEFKHSFRGKGDGTIVLKKVFLESIVANKTTTEPTVIIIDEMSKLTTLEWQILNELGKSNNYYIIALGDDLQNGVQIGEESFSLDNISFPTSVKLKSTIRAENIHKNDNLIVLEKFTYETKRKSFNLSNKIPDQVQLHYSEKDNKLNGDKFIPELNVSDLKKLDLEKEIAVITSDGKLSDEYKKLFAEAGIVKYSI